MKALFPFHRKTFSDSFQNNDKNGDTKHLNTIKFAHPCSTQTNLSCRKGCSERKKGVKDKKRCT